MATFSAKSSLIPRYNTNDTFYGAEHVIVVQHGQCIFKITKIKRRIG